MDLVQPAAPDTRSQASPEPWLSILIPVYNVERYLQECMESVLTQTTAGVEIIALDDVSTDGSVALLEQLKSKWDSAFSIMHHPVNRGISEVRNTLLRAARGQYVWFIDSDDVMQAGAVAELKSIVDREEPDLVLCDYYKLREKMKLRHRLLGQSRCPTFSGPARRKLSDLSALVSGLFDRGDMHVWSKVSKRSLWSNDLLFPRGKYFQDLFTMPLLVIRAKSYYYAPSVWMAYRQRAGSIQNTMTADKFVHMSEALIGFADELHRVHPDLSLKAKFRISHKCARNFTTAATYLLKHPSPQNAAYFSLYKENLMCSLAMPLADLRREYLKRGWFVRLQRLMFCLRDAGHFSKGDDVSYASGAISKF